MKRYLAILFALCLLLAAIACGGANDKTVPEQTEAIVMSLTFEAK